MEIGRDGRATGAGTTRIVVGAMVIALAGCGLLGEGSSGPIEVAGTDSVFDQGRVETACYTFETSPDYQYEMNPDAESCIGDVRWVGHDSLSQITVRTYPDSGAPDNVLQAYEDEGVLYESSEPRVVDGIEGVAVHQYDGWGLPYTAILVPLPEGR